MFDKESIYFVEREEDEVKIVSLQGSVLSDNVSKFQSKLEEYKNTKKLVLDLRDLEFMSSAGLGVMLSFFKDMLSRGNDVVLAEPRSSVMNVFKVVGLDKIFSIYNTVDSAVDYLVIKDL